MSLIGDLLATYAIEAGVLVAIAVALGFMAGLWVRR